MKKILSFLLLTVFLSACAAPSAVESVPEPAQVVETAPSVTFTAIPTLTEAR